MARTRQPGPWDKFYRTNRWARISKLNLKAHPVCTRCEAAGRTNESRLSHHVHEWQPNFTEMNFWYGPLDALCFECHAEVHGRPAKLPYRRDIDVSGWPADQSHPVYQTDVAKREKKESR